MTLGIYLMLVAFVLAGGAFDRLCGRDGGNVFDWIIPVVIVGASALYGLPPVEAVLMGAAWAMTRGPAWRWPPHAGGEGVAYVRPAWAHILKAIYRHSLAFAFVIPLWRVWYVAVPCIALYVAVAVFLGLKNREAADKGRNFNGTVEFSRGTVLHAMLVAPLLLWKMQAQQ